jgi:hypothetical protein
MNQESFLNRCQELGLVVKTLPATSKLWQRFILEDWFFNQEQSETELTYCDDQWELMTFKGYFCKINSPEELITHLYFEYFLPKKQQDDNFPLPVKWEELFKLAGLLEIHSTQFSLARKATLLKKLEEHFGLENGLKDLTFWQELSKEFPECIYTGLAYRAVLAHTSQVDENKVKAPGYSWALSLDGIQNFIKLGDSYSLKEDNGFVLYSGIISGISLIHIIKIFGEDKYKQLVGQSPSFTSEEEVIALEVISLNEGKFCKMKDIGINSY